MVDFWAHRHFDDPKLREQEIENTDYEADLEAMEAQIAAAQAAREAAVKAQEAEAAAATAAAATPPDPGDWEEVVADDRW